MKPWKLVLGAGAACAACCAAPLIGGLTALGAGTGLFAGGAGALALYAGTWLPLALAGMVAAGVMLFAWWRARTPKAAAASCGGCASDGACALPCGKEGN